MSDPSSLAAVQRRLFRLIASPEGVRRALAEETGEEPLSQLVRSDARLSAEDRLDVYANAYFYRILGVLGTDFPLLAAEFGETDFHDVVTSYLAVHPSEHPSLRYIGNKLERFLRESAAAAGVRERAPWAADLAAFEWARGEVFDAEDAHPATRADLADVAPEAFEALELELVPAVRLLTLDWPVDRLDKDATHVTAALPAEATALARDTAPVSTAAAALSPACTRLCIWRRDERTNYRRTDALEAEALSRLATGIAFGALCEFAAERENEAAAPALAAGWLARWLDDALLRPLARSSFRKEPKRGVLPVTGGLR